MCFPLSFLVNSVKTAYNGGVSRVSLYGFLHDLYLTAFNHAFHVAGYFQIQEGYL